ncbi:MAG: hypothetical protein ACK4XK_11435 [Casimicrobiaceae bacterium]
MIYDFVVWAVDVRPDLFVSEQDVELSANGAKSCCVKFLSIEAEVTKDGKTIESLYGPGAQQKIRYTRRFCRDAPDRRKFELTSDKTGIRVDPPLQGAERRYVRVRCVAMPKRNRDSVEIPAILEPHLYEYVTIKAMGSDTDSTTERAAAAERMRVLLALVSGGRAGAQQTQQQKG